MELRILSTAAGPPSRRQALFGMGALLLGEPCGASAAAPRCKIALIELMPWAMTGLDGRQSGIFVEASRRLAQLSGIAIEMVLLPYPRALSMLQSGRVDLMFALETERLNDSACRLAPIITEDVVMVGRPGLYLKSMSDLYGKTVGHLRFADYDAQFVAATGIVKYETNSYSQSLQMMRMARLDAMIAVRTALLFTLRSLDMGPETLGGTLLLRRAPISLYASKHWTDGAALPCLKKACDTLRQTGTLTRYAASLLAGKMPPDH